MCTRSILVYFTLLGDSNATGDAMVVEDSTLEGTYFFINYDHVSIFWLVVVTMQRAFSLLHKYSQPSQSSQLWYHSSLGTVASMNNVTISEEVRNAETLKNQLKYEKRATRLAESAVTSMASGDGSDGVDGDNNSGMLDASEIVLGLENGMSGAKAEFAGKGNCARAVCNCECSVWFLYSTYTGHIHPVLLLL